MSQFIVEKAYVTNASINKLFFFPFTSERNYYKSIRSPYYEI